MFQSTRPARGATRKAATILRLDVMFQSTRPARGATTAMVAIAPSGNCSFNPRAPHGPRRRFLWARPGGLLCVFQSTRPARGATLRTADAVLFRIKVLSIDAPRTGRDRDGSVLVRKRVGFNPRAPHGPRPYQPLLQAKAGKVSIHAPRTGRDAPIGGQMRGLSAFQSTRPARGATMEEGFASFHMAVSIHAPRTGRDAHHDHRFTLRPSFNPRAPHGARPAILSRSAASAWCFNPRAPHGARRHPAR